MLFDRSGNATSTIADAIAGEAPVQQKRKDYTPAPGRVTVLRKKAERHYIKDGEVDIIKPFNTDMRMGNDGAYHFAGAPVDAVEQEEAFESHATVARVGKQLPGGPEPWFETGDHVTIEPSLFKEVKLSEELSVWQGPFSGVTGVFSEE